MGGTMTTEEVLRDMRDRLVAAGKEKLEQRAAEAKEARRERLALAALSGLCANSKMAEVESEWLALHAVRLADAMIMALDHKPDRG